MLIPIIRHIVVSRPISLKFETRLICSSLSVLWKMLEAAMSQLGGQLVSQIPPTTQCLANDDHIHGACVYGASISDLRYVLWE
jgi:hypothetical protein